MVFSLDNPETGAVCAPVWPFEQKNVPSDQVMFQVEPLARAGPDVDQLRFGSESVHDGMAIFGQVFDLVHHVEVVVSDDLSGQRADLLGHRVAVKEMEPHEQGLDFALVMSPKLDLVSRGQTAKQFGADRLARFEADQAVLSVEVTKLAVKVDSSRFWTEPSTQDPRPGMRQRVSAPGRIRRLQLGHFAHVQSASVRRRLGTTCASRTRKPSPALWSAVA